MTAIRHHRLVSQSWRKQFAKALALIKAFTLIEVLHFSAGLGTGVFSALLLQPADLLKTRVQQQSGSMSLIQTFGDIVKGPNNALTQLWRGTLPSVIRTGLGSALYFSTLNALRQRVASFNIIALSGASRKISGTDSSSSLPRLSNMANLATGAVARASAGMVMMPVTVIKVRYESSLYSYRSISEAGKAILKTEGIKGFFTGFGATAIRDAPYAGLYVLFYEESKQRLSQLQSATISAEELRLPTEMASSKSVSINFLSGVLAAGLATAITNPFDAVKTRLQLMPENYGNMIKASQRMIREEGFKSFFNGLGLRMGRKAISSALAWTIYEELIKNPDTGLGEKSRGIV